MTTGQGTGDTALDAVLRDGIPEMQRLGLQVWAGMLGCAALGGLGLWLMLAGDGALLAVILAFAGIAGAVWLYNRLQRGRTTMLMPVVARSLGLEYDGDADWFHETLPPALLPSGNTIAAEDHLSGDFGARRFEFAELKISHRTGSGKHSSTQLLFKGFVLRLQLVVEFPDFELTRPAEPGFFRTLLGLGGAAPAGQRLAGSDNQIHSGADGHLRARQEDLAMAITGLPRMLGPRTAFHAAVLRSGTLYIACSHPGNLFDLPAWALTRPALEQGIRLSFEDVTLPLRMVSHLLEAEGRMVSPEARMSESGPLAP